jgi:pyrroline-5-carboxylate reductase
MGEILREIAPSLKPGALCMTIAAGLALRFYEELLPDHVSVIRAHPSPMMSVQRGCIALSRGERASDDDVKKAERLFALFSEETMLLPERDINLFAAMFGSSSALLYLFVDAILAAEEEKGQSTFSSKQVVAAMLDGASHMLLKSGKSPRALSEEICTPNGMTIAGVQVWEKKHVSETINLAMQAVLNRVKEMAATIK